MSVFADVRDRSTLAKRMAQKARPKFLFFWGHQPSADASVTKSCFSQWYAASFSVDGMLYRTAEHFMMAEKARLFGDQAIHERVLSASTPAQAKRLGRMVEGFKDETWLRERFEIVVRANCEKFSQNKALGQFLLDTGDRVLVEASPVDAIWGIGLAADHPDADRPHRWPGLNLLGFALMEVRQTLAKT